MSDPSRTYQELIEENSLLKQRVHDLENSEAIRKRVEREQGILNQIFQAFLREPDEGLYNNILMILLTAFESEFGVVGYIDEKGDLICPSMSHHVWDQCRMSDKDILFPQDAWGDSIWGNGLRTGKSAYSNEPFLVPEGHVPINSCLTAPLVFQGKSIGLLTVANNQEGYFESDKRLIETIANTIAPVLHARLGRKRAEKALQEREEQIRLAVEGSGVGLWDWRVQEGKAVFNERWAQIIGYTLHELEPVSIDTWMRFTHPDDLKESNRLIQMHFAGESSAYECEARMKHKDGHWVLVLDRGKVSEWDTDGKPLRMTGTHLDITGRKQAEEALRERVKELNCLYAITDFVELTDSLEELLQETVKVLPPAWYYPNHVCARITFKDQEFKTANFQETEWRISADVIVHGKALGTVDACYLVKMPDRDEGPFLKEERTLINAIAERLGRVIERQQAESELKESEEKYRSLIENINDIVWETDKRGCFTYVNVQTRTILGYEPEEIIGRPVSEFLAPDIVDENKRRFAEILQMPGRVITIENKFVHKDGSFVFLETKASATYTSDGVWTGFKGIDRDITKRKLVEAQLQSNARLLQNFIDYSHYLIYAKDLNGRFILASQSLAEFFGQQSHEQLIGKTSYDFLPNVTADQHRANDLEVVERGIQINIEETVETKEGLLTFISTKFPLFDLEGKLYAVCGASVNITERKKMEKVLRESEERYRNIFDNSIEGIFQTTPQGRYRTVNPSFARMFGYESPEDMIETVANIGEQLYVNPEDRKKLVALMDASKGMVRDFEVQLIRKDGSIFWVSITAQMIKNEADSPFIEGTCVDITEDKRAENALRASEQKYRTLTEQMPDMTWQKDIHGVYVFCNSNYADVLGVTVESIVGHRDDDFYKPELVAKYLADDQSVITTGQSLETEELWEEDGEARWLHTSKAPLLDEDGKVIGTIGIARDITDRKRVETALKESEEKYRNIIDASPVPFAINDEEGNIIFLNEAFTRSFGYTSEDIPTLADWWSKAYPDQDYQHQLAVTWEMRMEKARREGTALEPHEVTITCKNDLKRTAIVSAVGLTKSLEGTHLVILYDITERKQAEEELKNVLLFNKNIIDSAQEGIIVYDRELRYQLFSPFMEKHTGLKASDVIGKTSSDLFPFMKESGVVGDLKKILRGEKVEPREFQDRIPTSGRSGWVIQTNAPLLDSKGEIIGILGMVRDITEQKRTTEQLHHAQKMESIGTLAGGIAHDFNNILGAIIGYTEMAVDENQREIQREYLQETLKGAERAKNLVKQILTFSRRDDQEKKPLDIKILLKEAIKFLRASIPTTIEISQHITEDSCNIMADPTQMHQVIMNLCTNAGHAMKEAGGTLRIELANVELTKDEIPNYPDLQPGHYVKLIVSDTGHGIDPILHQRIFDPFFTTKSKGEGTGLGLSVVYGIVRSHAGVINVYSKPGKGASFSVYLPRIIHAGITDRTISGVVTGGTERILFVDDETALVEMGTRMLSSLGYEVTGVISSLEALDLFRSNPMSFDIVITDMTLPKMTGVDLAREILQIRPDIPIILCSGIRESATEEQVKSLGISAYLTKPLTKNELSRVIRDTLDKHENNIS